MRLIDADKLKEELEVNGLGHQCYMLDNAPTVKAIPIEWLINFIRKEGQNVPADEALYYWEKENDEL